MDQETRKRLARELLKVLVEDMDADHQGEAAFVGGRGWLSPMGASKIGMSWWPKGLSGVDLSPNQQDSVVKVLGIEAAVPASSKGWYLYEPLKVALEALAGSGTPTPSHDFAPGSGSDWTDRMGDPRIVEGSRVLLPTRFRKPTPGEWTCTTAMARELGATVQRVSRLCPDNGVVVVGGWRYPRCDLVLFDEGKERAIRLLRERVGASRCWYGRAGETWSMISGCLDGDHDWLVRADIVDAQDAGERYYTNPDRISRILDSLDALEGKGKVVKVKADSTALETPPPSLPQATDSAANKEINYIIAEIETIFFGAVAVGDEELASRAFRARAMVGLSETRRWPAHDYRRVCIEQHMEPVCGDVHWPGKWIHLDRTLSPRSLLHDAKTLQACREQLHRLKRPEATRATKPRPPERFQCYAGLGRDHPPLEPGIGEVDDDIDE